MLYLIVLLIGSFAKLLHLTIYVPIAYMIHHFNALRTTLMGYFRNDYNRADALLNKYKEQMGIGGFNLFQSIGWLIASHKRLKAKKAARLPELVLESDKPSTYRNAQRMALSFGMVASVCLAIFLMPSPQSPGDVVNTAFAKAPSIAVATATPEVTVPASKPLLAAPVAEPVIYHPQVDLREQYKDIVASYKLNLSIQQDIINEFKALNVIKTEKIEDMVKKIDVMEAQAVLDRKYVKYIKSKYSKD